MYSLLMSLKEDHSLNDPDTMKAYPIMNHHIGIYRQVCPNAEFYYNRLKNDETRRLRFFRNPAIQDAIAQYHKRYIAATGPMPPPPAWSDLSSANPPNVFGNTKSRKSRKNRKTRRNRKN